MHNAPVESGFLAEKFKKLAARADVHLLIWDSRERVKTFIANYDLGAYASRIHIGSSTYTQATKSFVKLLYQVSRNRNIRKYVLQGDDRLTEKLKQLAYYLPLFELKPDIIHFEFGTLAKDLTLLKQLSKAKSIVSFRGYDLNFIGLDNPNYYKDVWKEADALHFLGQNLKQRAIARGYREDKLEAFISPGIDTGMFRPKQQKITSAELRIVSVGRLTWKKGYEYALLALSRLRDDQVSFKYTIIGEGPHRQAIEYTVHELGLQNHVLLTGNLSQREIRDRLHKSDVFLHPAISEGFCNAVVEAQAAGLAVICSDADGLKENIEDEVTGIVFPKWDVQAIADRLKWVNSNRPQLKVMGEKGVERANRLYRIDDQMNAFLELYRKVYES
jgi:colanic acid/amylovoran biosynthesis glycosyltransferase